MEPLPDMLKQTPRPSCEQSIILTLVKALEGKPSCAINVPTAQMITYQQQSGFTRLRLIGGRVLDVREGTAEIDRLIRGNFKLAGG